LLVTQKIDVIEILARPVKPYIKGTLIVTHPSDLFDIVMNASLAVGLVVASPVIVWQVWGFMSPALYGHEKKMVIPALVGAAVLFLAGMGLAYEYVLPVTFSFLLGFQSASATAMLSVHETAGFVITMCLAFGAVFEMPIVVLLLTVIGVVKPQYLSRFRRHALVGCLIGAALITPGSDPWSLLLLTIPLYMLYEVSIMLSRFVFMRRERRLEAQDALQA
jgi:sec-independent protein translocase protein TatC